MASKLGVVFNEKDLSKSQEALAVPAGAMCVYAMKGRTDKAYLARSEGDILRNNGAPVALMTAGGLTDYNRGLHTALRMVRAGLPMYIMRAAPASVAAVKSSVLFERELVGSTEADAIKAEALGHGAYYDGLSIFVKGIETVTRELVVTAATAASLEENALPGTVVISDPANPLDVDDDTGVTYGDATETIPSCTLAGSTVVTYEDGTAGSFTTLTATNSVTIKVTYERTTQQRVVRVFICDDGEADPVNNNYENYLVSLKEDGKDEGGNACFIEDVINENSEIVKITVGSTYDQTTIPIASTAVAYVGGLAGGTEGTFAASDADIKGTSGVSGSTGLQVFRDRTSMIFCICLTPVIMTM